jgi:hypothetical protein
VVAFHIYKNGYDKKTGVEGEVSVGKDRERIEKLLVGM